MTTNNLEEPLEFYARMWNEQRIYSGMVALALSKSVGKPPRVPWYKRLCGFLHTKKKKKQQHWL
jgi:hypothetical protein